MVNLKLEVIIFSFSLLFFLQLTDRTLDSNFPSSEIKLKDNPWFTGNHCR